MKIFLTIVISLVFVFPCFPQQNLNLAFPNEITYRDSIAYFHNSPFTGILVDKKTNKPLGEFLNGYKNGKFIQYYSNGKIESEVEFSNGKILDGKYVTYLKNGQIEQEETYKDGKIISIGKYKDGKLSELSVLTTELYSGGQKKGEGYLKNDKKDSLWTEWFETGQIKSEGQYKNGLREGQWTIWYENGKKEFEGNYQDGKRNGQGIMNYKTGAIYNGTWKNDSVEGYGTASSADGSEVFQGNWKDGKINGKGSRRIIRDSVTSYHVGYFVNSMFNGQGTDTTKKANGTIIIRQGEFKNNRFVTGTLFVTFYNGMAATLEYKNGKNVKAEWTHK